MSRIPEPETTPDGPMYEGRLLDRADEEVVDQGVAFDIGTLVNRRSMLGILGVGAGALALAACAPSTAGSTATSSATTTATSTATATATASASASPSASA